MGESKYKIGDTVTIKDLCEVPRPIYRVGLNSDMLQMSGSSFKIIDIEEDNSPTSAKRVPDDGYRYKLDGEARLWSWASSMFVDPSEDLITHSVIETKDSSIDAFVKKEECPILDFSL